MGLSSFISKGKKEKRPVGKKGGRTKSKEASPKLLRDPALDSQREDGFYAHAVASPACELLRRRSRAGNGTLLVVQYGPWRVLWLQHKFTGGADAAEADFFQGVTFHDAAGTLSPFVVGFDYQRVLVAAALPFLLPDGAAQPPMACLIGLGAGSCAAALAALANGRFTVHAIEIDSAVVQASSTVHGVRLKEVPAAADGLARPLSVARKLRKLRTVAVDAAATEPEPVLVTVADAADEMSAAAAGSLSCIVLDAYDARGRVPARLQSAPFLASLAAALAPGGAVLANVWRVEPAERRASDAFARRLAAAVGAVFSLQVPGREGNLVLVAVKGSGSTSGAPAALEALRHRLRRVADDAGGSRSAEAGAAGARAGATLGGLSLPPELLACLQSNAATLRAWGH